MFTYDEVKNGLEKLIKENPDNVNPTLTLDECLYTSPINPNHHCLIGQWLSENGCPFISSSVLASVNSLYKGEQHIPSEVTKWMKKNLDLETVTMMDDYQLLADTANRWGDVSYEEALL